MPSLISSTWLSFPFSLCLWPPGESLMRDAHYGLLVLPVFLYFFKLRQRFFRNSAIAAYFLEKASKLLSQLKIMKIQHFSIFRYDPCTGSASHFLHHVSKTFVHLHLSAFYKHCIFCKRDILRKAKIRMQFVFQKCRKSRMQK